MGDTNQGKIDKMLNLLEKGVFTTGFITIVLTGVCAYCWIAGIPLDETLKTSWLVIMGFFFGNSASYQTIKYLTRSGK